MCGNAAGGGNPAGASGGSVGHDAVSDDGYGGGSIQLLVIKPIDGGWQDLNWLKFSENTRPPFGFSADRLWV